MDMKVLTLTQPWATLVVIGIKEIETRSWKTNHRGQLGIHAARTFPRCARLIACSKPFKSALAMAGYAWPQDLPTGAVLGVAFLAGCEPITDRPVHYHNPFSQSPIY